MQDPRNEYAGIEGSSAGTTARAWEVGEAKTGAAAAEIGSRARRLRDGASQTLHSAKEKVGVAYDRTADQAVRAYHGARGYAQSNPGMATAATFAAGLGIGMVVGGRTAARAYRRGLFSLTVAALAQAVRDVFDRRR